jgi:ATP-binding cassette subfamily B protein
MSFARLIKTYWLWVATVLILGLATNLLSLYVPKLSAGVIDGTQGSGLLVLIAGIAFIIAVIQITISSFFSEKVALDLRSKIIDKLKDQTYSYIGESTPGRLLTVATSDVDAVKSVFSLGLVTLLGAVVTLIGATIFLLNINVRLALYTIAVIPFLILSFAFIFGNIARLFRAAQENLEKINAVINETIVGAALIRVLNSAAYEIEKFKEVNLKSREIGMGIVKSISALIPIITLIANSTTMIIIWFGGKEVISHVLSIGNFSAFLSYSAMFIWPLFVLSFVGTMLSRAGVSLKRINEVLDAPIKKNTGTLKKTIQGKIEFKNVSYGPILKEISFTIEPQTRTAIIGPTGGGKTQLFYLMSGLIAPSSGEILIDGTPVQEYDQETLFTQIGLVFQDSIIFNATLRENISLQGKGEIEKALEVAELDELVKDLPQGLNTMISERGTSLSGGQKQRLMLARALAIHPKVLLLDDFTARVDITTEKSILNNINKEYIDITIVSITQKIEPIKSYDHIIVLMEGELVGEGRHDDLLNTSFEYQQIYQSQQTT